MEFEIEKTKRHMSKQAVVRVIDSNSVQIDEAIKL